MARALHTEEEYNDVDFDYLQLEFEQFAFQKKHSAKLYIHMYFTPRLWLCEKIFKVKQKFR